MTKRIGKTEQFEFDSLTNGKHLHVTIAVSGFCDTEDDSKLNFSVFHCLVLRMNEHHFSLQILAGFLFIFLVSFSVRIIIF